MARGPPSRDPAGLGDPPARRPFLPPLAVCAGGTGGHDRGPLAAGAGRWERALGDAGDPDPWTSGGRDRYAFLEYVEDDDPTNRRDDAATLRAWLGIEESTDA